MDSRRVVDEHLDKLLKFIRFRYDCVSVSLSKCQFSVELASIALIGLVKCALDQSISFKPNEKNIAIPSNSLAVIVESHWFNVKCHPAFIIETPWTWRCLTIFRWYGTVNFGVLNCLHRISRVTFRGCHSPGIIVSGNTKPFRWKPRSDACRLCNVNQVSPRRRQRNDAIVFSTFRAPRPPRNQIWRVNRSVGRSVCGRKCVIFIGCHRVSQILFGLKAVT